MSVRFLSSTRMLLASLGTSSSELICWYSSADWVLLLRSANSFALAC